jgi:4-hydroxy-2-oxoheptanedioate aldolase
MIAAENANSFGRTLPSLSPELLSNYILMERLLITELEKAKKLKTKLRAGEMCLGAQIALSDPAVAEIFGRAGFDWLVLDTEHTASNEQTVRAMLQAAVHTSAVALARPLRLDPDQIRRFLDLGSPGILCPFINTAEEARLFVSACRYPPAGIRGYGPRRAGVYGFDVDEYMQIANDCMICIPIIESRRAIENIESIVAVDGIDGVSVGPMDLSIDMGMFRQFEHRDYLAAVEKVRQACKKHGKAMGTGCYRLEHAKQCRDLGDSLLLAAGDDGYLASEAGRCIRELRRA